MLLVNTWFKRSLDIILFCKEQGDPGRREFQASVPLGLKNSHVDMSIFPVVIDRLKTSAQN